MFKDRQEAGEKLAFKIQEELGKEELEKAVILGIPRGGIIIGGAMRRILQVPFFPLITKKIPSPGNEELAIGAVGEGGVVVWEEELCQRLGVTLDYRQKIVKEKIEELERKKKDFGYEGSLSVLAGKVAILTDDGVATGATMKAGIAVAASFSPKEIVVAAPVIAYEALAELKNRADKVVCLLAPEIFFSLSQFYANFTPVTDEESKKFLKI